MELGDRVNCSTSIQVRRPLSSTDMDYISPFRRQYRRGGFHCDLCDCYVGRSTGAAQTHERGRRHVRRLRAAEDPSYFDTSDFGWCNVCQVNVWYGSLRQHNQGRTHRLLADRLVECGQTERTMLVKGLLTARMHNSHEDVVNLILGYV